MDGDALKHVTFKALLKLYLQSSFYYSAALESEYVPKPFEPSFFDGTNQVIGAGARARFLVGIFSGEPAEHACICTI